MPIARSECDRLHTRCFGVTQVTSTGRAPGRSTTGEKKPRPEPGLAQVAAMLGRRANTKDDMIASLIRAN